LHVIAERMGVHGDFRMRVRTHELRAFHANGSIAERRAFGGAGDNSDVSGHEAILPGCDETTKNSLVTSSQASGHVIKYAVEKAEIP